jgi:hypothetical protein
MATKIYINLNKKEGIFLDSLDLADWAKVKAYESPREGQVRAPDCYYWNESNVSLNNR